MDHKLEPTFKKRLARLEHTHPSAHRFMVRLLEEGIQHELWLSTATNAHLYKAKAYLMHIRMQGSGPESASIVLSPTPHIMFAQDAVDRSDLLFPRAMTKLVMDHGGYRSGWALRGKAIDLELKPSTPDAFFLSLFETLRHLRIPEGAGGT